MKWPKINWSRNIRVAIKKETGESITAEILIMLLEDMLQAAIPITYESLVKHFKTVFKIK